MEMARDGNAGQVAAARTSKGCRMGEMGNAAGGGELECWRAQNCQSVAGPQTLRKWMQDGVTAPPC